MDWKQDIRGCFGIVDHMFARHPIDQNNARALRKKLRSQNVNINDIQDAFETWMRSKKCSEQHIQEQSKKIVKYFNQ